MDAALHNFLLFYDDLTILIVVVVAVVLLCEFLFQYGQNLFDATICQSKIHEHIQSYHRR